MSEFQLNAATGPECPHCGCNDSQVIQSPTGAGWWGRIGKARCKHCHRPFSFQFVGPTAPPPVGPPEIAAQTPPVDHQAAPIATQDVPVGYVRFGRTICPDCGSGDTAIKSTKRPVRKHKCRACGFPFKSHEGVKVEKKEEKKAENPAISPTFTPRV